jgi:hypothetical protein
MVLEVVVAFIDSFMNFVTCVRDVEVCMCSMICYIPGCICYGSEKLGLESLHDDLLRCWRNPTVLFRSSIKV